MRHDGQEFLFVRTGVVRLLTGFYARLDLKRGDSGACDAAMERTVNSPFEDDATILWLTAPT